MKNARDFEDLDQIDGELERLRTLVKKAYSEGWYDGYVHEEKITDAENGWNKSASKRILVE